MYYCAWTLNTSEDYSLFSLKSEHFGLQIQRFGSIDPPFSGPNDLMVKHMRMDTHTAMSLSICTRVELKFCTLGGSICMSTCCSSSMLAKQQAFSHAACQVSRSCCDVNERPPPVLFFMQDLYWNGHWYWYIFRVCRATGYASCVDFIKKVLVFLLSAKRKRKISKLLNPALT